MPQGGQKRKKEKKKKKNGIPDVSRDPGIAGARGQY